MVSQLLSIKTFKVKFFFSETGAEMKKTWVSFKWLVFVFWDFELWELPSGPTEAILSSIPVGSGYQYPRKLSRTTLTWRIGSYYRLTLLPANHNKEV